MCVVIKVEIVQLGPLSTPLISTAIQKQKGFACYQNRPDIHKAYRNKTSQPIHTHLTNTILSNIDVSYKNKRNALFKY